MTKSPEQLKKISEEHLYYEMWMFFSVAEAIEKFQHADPQLNQIIKNALIESFAIHTRNLIDFLYPRSRRNDDITALDFFDKPMEWEEKRGELSDTIEKARKRADKEIAHLTKKRISGTPPEKSWGVVEIMKEINDKLIVFVENADPNRLSKEVIDFVKGLQGQRV